MAHVEREQNNTVEEKQRRRRFFSGVMQVLKVLCGHCRITRRGNCIESHVGLFSTASTDSSLLDESWNICRSEGTSPAARIQPARPHFFKVTSLFSALLPKFFARKATMFVCMFSRQVSLVLIWIFPSCFEVTRTDVNLRRNWFHSFLFQYIYNCIKKTEISVFLLSSWYQTEPRLFMCP